MTDRENQHRLDELALRYLAAVEADRAAGKARG